MKNNQCEKKHSSLSFKLETDEGWPPVGVESIPVLLCEEGGYEITLPPFFLQGLSVGDQIVVDLDCEGLVVTWKHTKKSKRSTIWLLNGDAIDLETHLNSFKKLKCNIERFSEFKLFAIDVPASVALQSIDKILSGVEHAGGHIAYPSFRH